MSVFSMPEGNRQPVVADDERNVLLALRELGIRADSLWDLVGSGMRYRKAIPLLIDALPLIEDRRVKEAIVRALTVREARGLAASTLLDEFERIARLASTDKNETLGWAVGNALAVVVCPADQVFERLVPLLRNGELGRSRQMLAEALVNTGDPRAPAVLVDLLGDADLTGHVLFALGKTGVHEILPFLRPYLGHSSAWVRKEARRAIAKLERRPAPAEN